MDKITRQKSVDPFSAIRLSNMIHGAVCTQLVFVAAKLGIADLLKDGGKSIKELAEATGTIESRLYRILRALASLEIFSESQPGYFQLTPLAELLRTDSSNSQNNFAIMMGSEWHIRGWANILHSVQKEESAFENTFKMNMFEYLQQHPADATVFNNAMTFTSKKQVTAILHAYDFSGIETLVDIGGGHGFLLSAVLKMCPTLKGILFDMPSVVKTVGSYFQAEGLDQRCQIIEGNFFDFIPEGGDIYMLKYIIHDWDDFNAVRILKNCRNVMNSNSKILVIDAVVPLKNPSFGKTWSDIEMMVMLPNGRERTESEFKNLFSQAGFKLLKIIPTKSELSIIEAVLA